MVGDDREAGNEDHVRVGVGDDLDLGEISGAGIGRVIGYLHGNLDRACGWIDDWADQLDPTLHNFLRAVEDEVDALVDLQILELLGGYVDLGQQ